MFQAKSYRSYMMIASVEQLKWYDVAKSNTDRSEGGHEKHQEITDRTRYQRDKSDHLVPPLLSISIVLIILKLNNYTREIIKLHHLLT